MANANEFELVIYNQEDRLTVAQILVKNGYTVAQGKRKKTESVLFFICGTV